MSTKTFCDRCEEDVKLGDNELLFTATRNSRFGYDKRYNLCNKCVVKFMKWLGAKK